MDETLSADPIRQNRGVGREVAVVGAGAVGLTAALFLARERATVTVYEAGTVANESSGRAAGVCYDAFAAEPNATLGREAIERFRSFAQAGAPFTSCPYLWLAQTGDEPKIDLVRDGIRRMQKLGVEATELDASEVAERFPALRTDDIAVAGLTAGAGYTDTAAYTEWLADQARAEGVTIEEETPVQLATDSPAVETGEGRREVDDLVVTAGAHSKQLLAGAGVEIAMKPYRVQALVGEVSLGDWEPMVYDTSGDCYLRPHSEGLLAGDGTEPWEADPNGYDRAPNEGFSGSLGDRVTHRLPECELDVDRAWAGLCTATPDRDPLVGAVRDRVYVATGFQGQGFMRSPAIGRRLADDILGGDGIPAFDPTRFDGDESFEVREGMAVESS
ncbi:Glycine/D-amino acid oxidase [Halovenus aranensis]|uniref:Glycine/D-amino acid oxidase n=1 Tax=Halovenus aranensis TaxID=890420 RepID=A0A1G8Y195_9EURY|nr:FAD-dependent oxidoreductase [Halovenus aranensis]SDJ96562.1 Glycine/D-amino acid oxidase [Halovenus aranensis]